MEPTEMKPQIDNQIRQQPFVSVIIPVFNDNESLRLCLAAITQQTYPQARYEVIVVDNNSQEDTTQVVDEFEGVVLVKEPQPGSISLVIVGFYQRKEVRSHLLMPTAYQRSPG